MEKIKPKTVAVVPSAGLGKRLDSKEKKPFVLLGGKPLIAHTLSRLEASPYVDAIIIAAERSQVRRFERLVKKYRFKKVIKVVVGGRTRFESVRNCLKRIGPSFNVVLIHDGARPFVDERLIRDSILVANIFGGCITALPESDTIKLADRDFFIQKTMDRSHLFRAQTPQSFRRDLIKKAYKRKPKGKVTDDASLVETMGKKVKILEGSYKNIKITTKEDLVYAEALLCASE